MKKYNLVVLLLVVVGLPLGVWAQTVRDYEYYLKKGQHLSDNNSFLQAVVTLDSAIKLKPTSAEAYEWRGYCNLRKAMFVEGLKDYDTAILYADNKNKLRLIERKEFDLSGAKALKYFSDEQILKVYDTAISLFPDSSRVYIDRAHYYSKRKKYIEAIADIKKAIAISPTPSNYSHLTYIMRYEDKSYSNQEILKLYDECIDRNPNIGEGYFIRANYYESKAIHEKFIPDSNKYETSKERIEWYRKAIADYNKAISKEPSNWKYCFEKVNCEELLHICSVQEILKDYDALIAVIPTKSTGYMSRANYYGNIHQYKEAIADLDTVIQMRPKYAEAYYKRAQYKKLSKYYKPEDVKIDKDSADFIQYKGGPVPNILIR